MLGEVTEHAPDLWETIERHVLPLPTGVQVAVSLVEDGATRFLGAERIPRGVQAIENRYSVFEIGSITKVFTATLLARAVVRGDLGLDEPVRNLLPFRLKVSQRGGVEMLLRHLSNHTSGIRHHQPPWLILRALVRFRPHQPFSVCSQRYFERYLRRDLKLASVPGERYRYSNMGMSLVGHVLSLHAGMSYERLLQTGIFTPLGMGASTTEHRHVQGHAVPGVKREGVAAPKWDFLSLAPAGGIKTNAADLARFLQAQLSPDEAMALTQKPTFAIERGYGVGLGWHMFDRPQGERWLNHGGSTAGYTADVNLNREARCGVAVLSNLGGAHKRMPSIRGLCRGLLEVLESSP